MTISPPAVYTQSAQSLVIPKPVLLDISAFYGLLDSPILVADADAVGGEIFNVMSTLVGDDVMNPLYGCDLPRRVFEPCTPQIVQQCLNDVFFAAKNWVPQVTVDISQTVVYANADQRMVGVAVAYSYASGKWLQDVYLALSSAFSGAF